ncbi:putative filamentation protein [Eutypa lata UCREL1]|uniref:Putative filamentation protein n=1 Tax=Eutypa lata (strain UCR-EL1) TaxID=1287681 RepID=M7TUW1_EUTLA|nr:putative filamentation protein [Eutypa lata UCREL1]
MSNPAKAARYLGLLENARCDGNWDEVPELVRKIRKHANDRSCLTTTAETEHAIIKTSHNQQPGSRPQSANHLDLDIGQLLPKLRDALDGEAKYPEDRFQAQVCLGWLLWTVGEYEEAQIQLPQTIESAYAQFDQAEKVSEWTQVCTLKGAYLKANCLARSELKIEALTVFESALAILSSVWESQNSRKQLQFWAELFLTEYCMLQAKALERKEKLLDEDDSLAPFRTWGRYWEASKAQGIPLVGGYGFRGAVPRRRVWDEYYAALSGILQQDLQFPTGYMTNVANKASARNELRIELKKVEAAYEGLLLTETTFPRADEERREVENFVAIVIKNWNVLTGRHWHEQDLGTGGKEGLSRGVLDILYRAATKTFHSTAILRYLFVVHLAVAEFDLAFNAFDSYLEIVKRGKARVDKTGHPEPSLDDDETAVETIVQAITALCKYGFHDAAEKAHNLAIELEGMLQKLPSPFPNADDNIPTLDEEDTEGVVLHPRISSRVHGLAWQAIGLAHAQWSRATYEASARSEIQTRAIRSFQKSLSPETGNPTDVRTLFTLGLLLAEQRELSPAIEIVKAALMSNKRSRDEYSDPGSYWRERTLIPLWHLLALLLSARQDFLMAARACEGAFEQFDDPAVLFGSQSLDSAYRSDHLNEVEAKARPRGLVDEMDDLEKEGIIEVKMTQLALLELLEGPEVAVNASHELLVLYSRLFGILQHPTSSLGRKNAEPPKSATGTLRSFRGSIFGSKSEKATRGARSNSEITTEKSPTASNRPRTTQSATSATSGAPAIQVTKENAGDLAESRSIKRQRQATLVKVWLMVAGFYRRAKMHKDSKGAIEEARKIVETLEAEIALDPTGSVTLRNPGWGGKKSADELRSDVRAEMGHLALAEGTPYIARSHFEEALMHFPDHPSSIVGLSNILLDIYSEVLLPPPTVPGINLPDDDGANAKATTSTVNGMHAHRPVPRDHPAIPTTPLGLGPEPERSAPFQTTAASLQLELSRAADKDRDNDDGLPAPYKATSLPLVDRLAARDRAYGLLSGLTKLGAGWNRADAWFALARAYEESGQLDRAKEALWWCVELEEGTGARGWECVGVGGYVL